jgi:glycosyltransferase involved in cell wall biosynthesis
MVAAARNVADDWELIIVDKGSSDSTQSVIREFICQLPVRGVFEPNAGLSNARNAGILASSGNFVLWTDDDVLVDEHWLRVYFRAFKDHPEHAVFGGRTEPVYEAPEQDWFKANQAELCSLLAIRDEPSWTSITPERVPYGLNFAIRGEEQRSHLYDPGLGVAPGRRGGGEEVAVIREILALGFTGLWLWDATVLHLIPISRQDESYIRKFYSAHGYDYPVAGHRSGRIYTLKGIAKSVRIWINNLAAYALKRRFNRAESVPHLIRMSQAKASIRRYSGLGRAE